MKTFIQWIRRVFWFWMLDLADQFYGWASEGFDAHVLDEGEIHIKVPK